MANLPRRNDENPNKATTITKDSTEYISISQGGVAKVIKSADLMTKGNVGLGNIENIAPADMPISEAQGLVNNAKADKTYVDDKNTAQDTEIASIQNALETQIYGVKYNETTGVGERIGDAIGLVLSEPDGIIPAPSDFDGLYPWNTIQHVKINKNGLRKEQSDYDYDTFDGNYYTKIDTSHFYVKDSRANGFRTIQIANMPIVGFHKIVKEDEVLFASVPITVDDNGDYGAKLDKPFLVNTSYTTFNTNILALGDKHHGMFDGVRSYVKEVLSYVEMGGMNDKKYFGRGINSGMPSSSSDDYKLVADTVNGNIVTILDANQPFYVGMLVQVGTSCTNNSKAQDRFITGITTVGSNLEITLDGSAFDAVIGDAIASWAQPVLKAQFDLIGDGSGYILQFGSINRSHCCYRGMWDTYGNMWQLLGGNMRYDGEIFLCSDPSKFNVVDPRNQEGWVSSGHTPLAPDGYQKVREAIQINGGSVSIPLEWGSGASSETFYSAYIYNFTDVYMGTRVLLVGGDWGYGGKVSPVSSIGHISPSYSRFSLGSRLIRY